MKYVKTDGRKWYKQIISGIILAFSFIFKIIVLSLFGITIGAIFAKVEIIEVLTVLGGFAMFILIIFGIFLLDCIRRAIEALETIAKEEKKQSDFMEKE